MTKILEEMIKYKLEDNEDQVLELLGMLDEERETAKRGMRIWYEEEFEQINARLKKRTHHERSTTQKRNC